LFYLVVFCWVGPCEIADTQLFYLQRIEFSYNST
jgi:hypothetical protein